jgi:hypothetical protein
MGCMESEVGKLHEIMVYIPFVIRSAMFEWLMRILVL